MTCPTLNSHAPAELWHPGAPPFVGWWNASTSANPQTWRWWDGWRWSWAAGPEHTPVEAASRARRRLTAEQGLPIRWTWAWPEGARTRREPPTVALDREPADGPWLGTPARLWRKGPPPHPGWWNAATRPRAELWRWWNGRRWSAPVHRTATAEEAARIAAIPAKTSEPIRWTIRYPRRTAVPRALIAAMACAEVAQLNRLQEAVRHQPR